MSMTDVRKGSFVLVIQGPTKGDLGFVIIQDKHGSVVQHVSFDGERKWKLGNTVYYGKYQLERLPTYTKGESVLFMNKKAKVLRVRTVTLNIEGKPYTVELYTVKLVKGEQQYLNVTADQLEKKGRFWRF